MHSLAIGKTLRKAPLFAHRTDQRDQFDHDQRRREATQGVRAVEASRDEEERQTRDEAQNETEKRQNSSISKTVRSCSHWAKLSFAQCALALRTPAFA